MTNLLASVGGTDIIDGLDGEWIRAVDSGGYSTLRQIVQDRGKGRLRLIELPEPIAAPGQVVIANQASVISAGTEKMARDLARKSLIEKARERPDQVRRVVEKVRQEGLIATVKQVRSKLSEPMPLGYSSAGVVLACGDGVQGVRPGDRVASNGPHAEVVSVPRNLCGLLPEPVTFEHGAFGILGALALQGLRLADVGLGGTVYVLGLGLVGQLVVGLAVANGCRVLGSDLDAERCVLAERMGAEVARRNLGTAATDELTGGLGADAVVIAAATPSSEPVALAAELVRKKGRVVVIGAVGMDLPRTPYYMKEAEVVVSCSYGPGRYDPFYEDRGHDYPAAYVRWTEQRNLQAVIDLLAKGRLEVEPLISHRFDVGQAEDAYRLIDENREPFVGVVLRYPELAERKPLRRLGEVRRAASDDGRAGVAVVGTGNFARSVLLPAIEAVTEQLRPDLLCSARGLSAADAVSGSSFTAATCEWSAVLSEPGINAVFIATRHDLHAAQVEEALAAGKHVFVEKPLALTVEEVERVEAVLAASGNRRPLLMVDFNRRFSPAARRVREHFEDCAVPLTVSVRFNAGSVEEGHWVQDPAEGGGRIIGEACHAIDLATYLVGSPPVRVFAESIGGPTAPAITHDQCFITLRHADGSVSSVGYLAGGDRSYPKERIEVFGGGRVAVIEDFREVVTVIAGRQRRSRFRQDKGHRSAVAEFARAVTEGGPEPISWAHLRAVSLAAILAVRSLREGYPLAVP